MSSEYEILKSEFEKLKAELAEYKERFNDARKTALAHSEELTFRGQRISDLKAKLAEVEAELKKAQGIAWDRKCELRKEREAANVIREALEQLSRGRFSFGDMCEIIREALTKADEIRGEE